MAAIAVVAFDDPRDQASYSAELPDTTTLSLIALGVPRAGTIVSPQPAP
jgi:hypothetical protein